MTLKNVEARSGVSATHISQIERGLTSPTVGALQKLARALDKETVFFLEEIDLEEVSVASEPVSVVLFSEHPKVVFKTLTHGIPGGKMRIGRLEVELSGGGATELHSHEGEESGYVIRGTLEIRFEDRTYTVKAGETIHFNATRPHSYANPGQESVEAIWVGSVPGFM